MQDRLSLRDLLLIAEETLGAPYDELEKTVCVFRAAISLAAPFARIYGADLHPDPVERAAICALRLIRTRPFLDGNREVGYECMREMLVRSGYRWAPQTEDPGEVRETLERAERRRMTDAEFVAWVRSRATA